MTEDLLDGSDAETLRPAASLTSSMIKRRRPVRVATPEDASAPHADAPAKAARDLAARVEQAFPGDAPQAAPEQLQPPTRPQPAPQTGTAGEGDDLLARHQELRRLAAERAEAQNRPLADDPQPEPPAQNGSPAAHDAVPQTAHGPSIRRAPPASPSSGTAAETQGIPRGAPAHAGLDNIELLRNGPATDPQAPGGRRKSLVQGGMTALERRRAALEQHRRLTDAQARRAAEPPRDIATYWDELRRGRQVPSMIDVDPHEIARHWPNSLLISCDDLNGAATLERSFAEVMRGARERATVSGEIVVEYTPMVTEWIMTVGREVARGGRPVQDIEVFPTSLGNVSYRVIALPLSGERLGTVHALCYIAHA